MRVCDGPEPMDISRTTFLPFTHTRALTSQQSLLKQEPRGASGPGPQAIKDFCKISGPCLHPHPEAASLSGFKSVEWTEVTTQGLPHPPMSSCGSAFEDEDDVHSFQICFFLFFFPCLWLCVVASRSPGSSVEGAPAAPLRPRCASSHWLCDFYSSPGHFFWEEGETSKQTPPVFGCHTCCIYSLTPDCTEICVEKKRAPLQLQLKQELV